MCAFVGYLVLVQAADEVTDIPYCEPSSHGPMLQSPMVLGDLSSYLLQLEHDTRG